MPNPPAVIGRDERLVEIGFWKKFLRVAGHIPFAEELGSAYFCATDPATPLRVKGLLLAALAYFVTPIDAIPDFIAGIGFTDDAAVLAATMALIANHLKPEHKARARDALGLPSEPN